MPEPKIKIIEVAHDAALYLPIAVIAGFVAMWRARHRRWWNIVANGVIGAVVAVLAGTSFLDWQPDMVRTSFAVAFFAGAMADKGFDLLMDWVSIKAGVPLKRRKTDA